MAALVEMIGESAGIAGLREAVGRLLDRRPDEARLPTVRTGGGDGYGQGAPGPGPPPGERSSTTDSGRRWPAGRDGDDLHAVLP
ncbi:MAG: hypothetical protein ACRDKW_06865, partial [Actinomycetota bacterium]